MATLDDQEEITDPDEDEVIGEAPARSARSYGNGSRKLGTDEYITRVTGRKPNDEIDSDVEITDVRDKADNGKRKAVDSDEEWSSQEEIYTKFRDRKAVKRKQVAASKKKIKEKAKEAAANRQSAKLNGETSKDKKERMWGDVADYSEMVEDEIPEYVVQRRQEFDKDYDTLYENGLRTPPRYDDIDFSDDERLEELEERPNFPVSVEHSRAYDDIELPLSAGVIPASIAQYLRDYQVAGVIFLHEMFVYQRGGILGDDMGLGKTVQVVAFLTAAFGKTGDERDAKRMRKMRRALHRPWYPRILIVCPGTLIQNWKNELDRWGWWHADKFHGTAKDRDMILETAASGRLEIIITTYSTYRIHKLQINTIQWDCVIADECHMMKERTAAVTQAMNEVNALCRIGLTGTAIQNKYEEMWTLLNWTNPGRFGPISTWVTSISEPLRIGQSHDATYAQLNRARKTANRLVENLLPQFFLRRMKSLIAHQLPRKTDRVVFCPLTDLQRDSYERFLEGDVVEIVRTATEPCDCGKPLKRGWCCHALLPESSAKWNTMVFPIITTLQKLSNHLALLIPSSTDTHDKQQRDLDFLMQMLPDRWEELYNHRDKLTSLANRDFCGKWIILSKLLKFWHENGDKVLIFSHSVKLLRLLEHLAQGTKYNVSFLSGSMANEDRQTTVDDFNSDPDKFIFLISTKAGGVGLNITSANKVVIFDPNWNPSYDLQAQDRAYRIGQNRDVDVYRLVSAGTVEEIVYARQIYKQQQANIGYNASMERRYFKGVQNAPGQKGEIFGLDNLLSYRADDSILKEIVNATNVAEAKQGVYVLDVDMDEMLNDEDNPLKADDDKEDAAMSQLAALVTEDMTNTKKSKSKPQPKADPVAAILALAGVEYTHENSEVVGSSKVEAELSRRAEEAGNDVQYGEERLFGDSQSASRDDGRKKYIFRPPEEVMKRQFCTMAKTFGFSSATEFACVVEGWTQKQRTDCLNRFYMKRRERLAIPDGHSGIDNAVPDVTPKNPEGEEDTTMADLDKLLESDENDDIPGVAIPKKDDMPRTVIPQEDIETEDDDDDDDDDEDDEL